MIILIRSDFRVSFPKMLTTSSWSVAFTSSRFVRGSLAKATVELVQQLANLALRY